MRAVPLVIVLIVGVSGCLGGSGNEVTTTPDPSSTQTSGTGGTSSTSPSGTAGTTSPSTTGPAGDNTAPAASLVASASGLNATFNLTGADDDGDELSWTLDVADAQVYEGDVLPTQVNHTFSAPGNYTIILEVTDGTASTEANVTLNLTVGGEPIQVASTEWTAGFGGCGATYDPLPPDAAEGGADALWGYMTIDPLTFGQAYAITFDLDGTSNLGGGIDFYDAEGAALPGGDLVLEAPYVVTGTVPADAAFAITYSCGATGGSADYAAG